VFDVRRGHRFRFRCSELHGMCRWCLFSERCSQLHELRGRGVRDEFSRDKLC
jgi:hypothetical protein